MSFRLLGVLATAALGVGSSRAAEHISYESFTLPNGLRLIVHEDHKAPVVAIRVAYHVGAKNEPVGKTGFAHLFEHLMFKGSEHFKGDFFRTLDEAGARETNGETSHDATVYYETVPTPALELALWLESERMGHFVSVVTPQVLQAEIGVVQNEKRQREAGPLGMLRTRQMEGLFPEGHPYRRSVLGSMADLGSASIDDVKAWFTEYYGAANATVVLAGDVTATNARSLVEQYFGHIAAGPPVHRSRAWAPERDYDVHEEMQARVKQRSLHRSWVAPPPSDKDCALLVIGARILNGTLDERLHGELVVKRKLATAASASIELFEIASVFTVGLDMRPGVDPGEAQRALDHEIARFLERGPTRKELERIKADLEAFRMLGMQSVSAKAATLADAVLLTGDPGFTERTMRWIQEASTAEVRKAMQRWLSRGYYQLAIHPYEDYATKPGNIDRSVMPRVKDELALDLPPIQEATLSNGIKVVLAERHEAPLLSMSMVFRGAGTVADRSQRIGTARAMFDLMGRGPAAMSEVKFNERLGKLHANISMLAAAHDARSSLSVLKRNLSQALRLWAQALRSPAFRAEDLERWREDTLRGLEGNRSSAVSIANRMLSLAIYPEGHPYAPRGDSPELVQALSLEDLRAFHAAWVRPDNAKLFIVGDTTLPEITRELESSFAAWNAPATPLGEATQTHAAPIPTRPRFILVDWPGEQQTQILVGRLVMSAATDEARSFNAANDILGGGATARLGQRLRVEKGWSYDIGSSNDGALGQQHWRLSTRVQTDKAAAAVVEISNVLEDFVGERPATVEELQRFVKGASLGLPGLFEDLGSVLNAMVQNDAYGKPYDWTEGARQRLAALELGEVNRVAREYLQPKTLTWVLVGDVSKFEQPLRDLGLGAVEVWDRDGGRVR